MRAGCKRGLQMVQTTQEEVRIGCTQVQSECNQDVRGCKHCKKDTCRMQTRCTKVAGKACTGAGSLSPCPARSLGAQPLGTAGDQRSWLEAGMQAPDPHPDPAPLTPTHEVLPEEGQAEVASQCGEEGPDAWEQLREAGGAGDEVAEGADAEDAVGVGTNDVVVAGGQVVCLHQLQGQRAVGTEGTDRALW